MNIFYELEGMLFEWDSGKAQSNIEKHDIGFEEAAEAFLDPFQIYAAASNENVEQRDTIIGYSRKQNILLVVYTERHDANHFGP